MTVTAKDVMALRARTGLGMMDCKQALLSNEGDAEAAEQWLRERRKESMQTRTERAAGEGRIGILVQDELATIVEVRSETDFTARTDAFKDMVDQVATLALAGGTGAVEASEDIAAAVDEVRITTGENIQFARGEVLEGGPFGTYVHHDFKRGVLLQVQGAPDAEILKGVCQHIVFHDPMAIGPDDVPDETIEAIRTKAVAEAEEAGKPPEIAQKMAEGRVRKHLEKETLLGQPYVLDEDRTVAQVLGDGVTVVRFVRYTLGAE